MRRSPVLILPCQLVFLVEIIKISSGQMMFMPEWNVIMFLSSPGLVNLVILFKCRD
jgi:hypothetical protein